MAIPYGFILLVGQVGREAEVFVRTAHGLSRPYSSNQGFPQGGRYSPDLWTIFDDPLCTAMNAESDLPEGDPVVVSVPFARAVKLTGKSFADDKRFVASSLQGLQRRFDLSALWNLLNSIETNVKKSAASAMIHVSPGKLCPKEDLPEVSMMNWATGEREIIEMSAPDEPLKSLGMLTTLGLSDGYAVDEAKKRADRVGVCVAKGTAPQALWYRLLDQVAQRSALYCIRTASVGEADIKDIQARCFRALKARAGLCITTPNEVVSALVSLDWASVHFSEQLLMVMKHLQRPGTKVEALLCSAIQQHGLWQGGDCTLGAKGPVDMGWDSTLLGRLHLWMAGHRLELVGPVTTPMARDGDALLRSYAVDEADAVTLAKGSWIVEAWRMSDCLCWDGSPATSMVCGVWENEIDAVTPALGALWCRAAARAVEAWQTQGGDLGCATRGSITTGTYVCFPGAQASAHLPSQTLTLARVVSDHRERGGWQDTVEVKLLKPLPLVQGEADPNVGRGWGRLPMTVPRRAAQEEDEVRRGGPTRGSLYAESVHCPVFRVQVSSLLAVKVVETRMRKALVMTLGGLEHTTDLLVQLDEDLDPESAAEVWGGGGVDRPSLEEDFSFADKEQVIGEQAAADRGWPSGGQRWERLLWMEADRRTEGRRTVLMLISDGSVKGGGFTASSTYGWVCYALAFPGLSEGSPDRHADIEGGYALAGGGKVAGPPEWTSSARAEATGLLAALMGAVTAGWRGDMDLRLDNDSVVGRAGGLVMEEARGFTAGYEEEDCADVVIRGGLATENSDIWTEFAAWRDAHCASGSRVTITWHPGHPEKRKSRDKQGWDRMDHAIFLADEIAETMHTLPTAPRTPTAWSHHPPWTLRWRGTVQHGCIAKRLHDAVRTELLASYVQGTGLGPGTDTDWLIPELVARTIAVKEGDLAHRVHRAKVTASILGTKYTQHRRGGLDADDDPMCRLCGVHLETDDHVLWRCRHGTMVQARQALSRRVKAAWRAAGLGLGEVEVARLLWTLDADGAVRCGSSGDIDGLLGMDRTDEACLLKGALLGHTLDDSGVAAERNGMFGAGWLGLLQRLGLRRHEALDALVAVSGTLHGDKGTSTLWRAFTTTLEMAAAESPPSPDADFDVWLLGVREQLREEGVAEDEPYRALSAMAAVGVTATNRTDFTYAVECWVGLSTECRAGPGAPRCLSEVVLAARAQVVDARRRAGRKQIMARDLARADAKMVAMERRTKQRVPPQQGQKRGAGATFVRSLPRRGEAGPQKRAMTRPRLDKGCKRRLPQEVKTAAGQLDSDQPPRTRSKLRGGPGTKRREVQEPKGQAATKKTRMALGAGAKRSHDDQGSDQEAEQEATERPKTRARANAKQGDKRGHEDEEHDRQRGPGTPVRQKTRSRTREQCSIGTTNLEPD
jgi:hypothetical protein